MRRIFLVAPVLWLCSALSLFADARMSVLVDVIQLPQAAQILSEEGLRYGETLNQDMLNGEGGPGWQMQVESIYDPTRMVEQVRAELARELSADQVEDIIGFFAGDLGAQIILLENSARRAIQDPDVEEVARGRYAALEGSSDGRLALITTYIESGDMIARNVTSAMNSNYQFLRGLTDGGALRMSEDEILKDVADGIEASTEDTTGWLYGYMLLAYSPLTDAELETYIAFADSPAGQALNRALFAGFGKAYEDISYGLGRAVALNMTAQDL